MSTHSNLDQTYLPPIKDHARKRWHDRFNTDRPLEAAWRTAKPVEAPAARCSHARLFEQQDALMLVRDGWLRTVLINDGRLSAPGLVMCEECDDLVDPISDKQCPSCGVDQPAVQSRGRITVVRRGDDR
jgi:rubrerythrin